MTGDIFGSCRCDCGPQLEKSMKMIEENGKGIIVYMNQEGRGIGLLNKLKPLFNRKFSLIGLNIGIPCFSASI